MKLHFKVQLTCPSPAFHLLTEQPFAMQAPCKHGLPPCPHWLTLLQTYRKERSYRARGEQGKKGKYGGGKNGNDRRGIRWKNSEGFDPPSAPPHAVASPPSLIFKLCLIYLIGNIINNKPIKHKSSKPFPFLFSYILNVNKFSKHDFRKLFRLPSIHVQHFYLHFLTALRVMRLSEGRNLQVSLHILSTWGLHFFPPWSDCLQEELELLFFSWEQQFVDHE